LSRPNKAGAEEQIALRSLIDDMKHTIAELAAAEGRLLSIGELSTGSLSSGEQPPELPGASKLC